MLNEEVRKIMDPNPVVVRAEDTVKNVSAFMVEKKLQQLPVVDDDGKLLGIITSYDLWQNLRDSKDSESQMVKEVMITNVLVIQPKDKMGTAAELFIDRRFKTLPVVNLENKLKGVITAFDVIKYVMKKEYPEPILYKDVLEDNAQVE